MELRGPRVVRQLTIDPMVGALLNGGSIQRQTLRNAIDVFNPSRFACVSDLSSNPSPPVMSMRFKGWYTGVLKERKWFVLGILRKLGEIECANAAVR